MRNGRVLIFSLFLIGLSILLQTVPTAINENFILLTLLSALPVFILTDLHLPLGFTAYISVGVGTAVVNPYDAVLFWGVTGVLGLSGGLWYRLFKSRCLSAFITSIILAVTALTINLLLSLYTIKTAYSLPGQFALLTAALFPCCLVFIFAAAYISKHCFSLIDLDTDI